MFAAEFVFAMAFFLSTPRSFSLSKLNVLNPSRAANALIGNGRFAGKSAKSVRPWNILRFASFVSADADGKVTVSYQGRPIVLRLYYMNGFNPAAAPYLGPFSTGCL